MASTITTTPPRTTLRIFVILRLAVWSTRSLGFTLPLVSATSERIELAEVREPLAVAAEWDGPKYLATVHGITDVNTKTGTGGN
jgi:hypothetical protein